MIPGRGRSFIQITGYLPRMYSMVPSSTRFRRGSNPFKTPLAIEAHTWNKDERPKSGTQQHKTAWRAGSLLQFCSLLQSRLSGKRDHRHETVPSLAKCQCRGTLFVWSSGTHRGVWTTASKCTSKHPLCAQRSSLSKSQGYTEWSPSMTNTFWVSLRAQLK